MDLPYIPPEWVQVIFTGILVVITGVYAYFTHKMAHANQDMAKAAIIQAEYIEKEKKSRIIISMIHETYKPLFSQLQLKRRGLSNNNYNPLNVKELVPLEPILENQVHPPDKILQKYNDRINELSKKYDSYYYKEKEILKRFSSKQSIAYKEFINKYGKGSGSGFFEIIGENYYLASLFNNLKNYPKEKDEFIFNNPIFIDNKDEILEFYSKSGISEIIDEYNLLKEEFTPLVDEFSTLIINLVREWQIEYSIIDSDLNDP